MATHIFATMRKWAAFILLLITLKSAFLPCIEIDGCCPEATTLTTPLEGKSDCDCLPFISCNNCPPLLNAFKPIDLAFTHEVEKAQYARVNSMLPGIYSNPLFQPPRSV